MCFQSNVFGEMWKKGESMEKPIIQIQNMGKTFKTANGLVKALDQINLDI